MVASPLQAVPPETADDLLLPELVIGSLGSGRIGAAVRHEISVDSTNRLARELARQGAEDGTVVIAEQQTAGRGRRQRRWVSPAGKGIYLSVLLRSARPVAEAGPAVQLVAGIAVAEALASFCSLPIVLRWPNDCYIGDRKVAGVLVESGMTGRSVDFLICGIGVNVNHETADFPVDLQTRATSLRLISGRTHPRLPVLVSLLQAFERWQDTWRSDGLAPVVERWLELSPASLGSYVEIHTEQGCVRGIADGLSPTGGLFIKDSQQGRHEITVGELVRLTPCTSEAQRRT